MSNWVIRAENLSKAYQLGEIGTGTISRDIERWWAKIRGKEDPFMQIGDINDRTKKGNSDIVWSLRDISFEVEQGEAIGIIGRNGAGKSTLLKLLSKITSPTCGSALVKGRVASLLEVGTGFHPELTGRENIYLNGAILGMRKKEIDRNFDAIVDFAGVERYVDTPVKRYSSGMYVRLAFAVAAHLESEILIVDEVLAVGDAEFQKKCIGKMNEVSSESGKTILFVSHNMQSIQKLCNKGMLLDNGALKSYEDIHSIINLYLNSASSNSSYTLNLDSNSLPEVFVEYAYLQDIEGRELSDLPVGKRWKVKIRFKVQKKCHSLIIALGVTSAAQIPIMTTFSEARPYDTGSYEAIFTNSDIILSSGIYNISIGISEYERALQYLEDVLKFNITQFEDITNSDSLQFVRTKDVGFVLNKMKLEIKKE